MQESEFLQAAEAAQQRLLGFSGLEYLNWAISTGADYPFGKLLNMRLTKAGDGFAEIEAKPAYKFYNPMMRIHGGYLAALMDSALGSAVLSKLPGGSGAGTVQLSVNYVRKVDVESGTLTIRGTALHAGRMMLTAEGQLKDAAGHLCVHATGAFLVYPK